MECARQYRYILSLLVWVIPFFFIPFLFLGLFLVNYDVEARCYTGTLFVSTPAMNRIQGIIVAGWFIGVFAGTVKYLRGVRAIGRLVSRKAFPVKKDVAAVFEDLCEKLEISQNMEVYECEVLPSPVVTGIFRKAVILPEKEYTRRELEIIFTHELLHVKQHIMIWKGVAGFVRIVHWFNPIAYLVAAELDKWAEIACDISVHNYEERTFSIREYFNLGLDELNRYVEKEDKFKGNGITRFWKDDVLLERVEIMKKYDAKRDMKKGMAVFLVLCFCLCSGMTTSAAGLGVNEAFEKAYQATTVEEDGGTFTDNGYEVFREAFDMNDENAVLMEDTEQINRATKGFTWSVPKGKMYYTTSFFKTKGSSIQIMVNPSPANKTIRIGVIEPSGVKVFIHGQGNMYYNHVCEKTGTYRMFVENISDTTVTVNGSYIY